MLKLEMKALKMLWLITMCKGVNMGDVLRDLTGQRFGRLTVIKRTDNYILKNGRHKVMWLCRCDCGTIKIIRGESLKQGDTLSCGCYNKEQSMRVGRLHAKEDIWNLKNKKYGIGCDARNNKFYFDKEDFEKIKYAYWSANKEGYFCNCKGEKLHRIIMNCNNSKIFVDHINHDTSDNRKCNLRLVTNKENIWNGSIGKNNVSGHIGVSKHTLNNSYVARVGKHQKSFNITKLGKCKAYYLVCEWVEKKDLELKGEFSPYYNHNIDKIKN